MKIYHLATLQLSAKPATYCDRYNKKLFIWFAADKKCASSRQEKNVRSGSFFSANFLLRKIYFWI
jgi:hypothetical protein